MGKKYAIDERTLGSIADVIRQQGGDFVGKDKMTTLEMARDKIPMVYHNGCSDGISIGIDIGKEQGRKSFMEDYQQGGKRTNYSSGWAGIGWTDETYDPLYDMVCSGSAQTMFGNSMITSTKRTVDWSNATSTNYAFASCTRLIEIVLLIVSETTPYHTSTFSGVANLVEMRMGGTIGQDGFDISKATKLSKASHLSVFSCISTTASITVTFSKVAVDKAFETAPGANDGSTSQEWKDQVASRPLATIVLA